VTYLMPRSKYGDFEFFAPKNKQKKYWKPSFFHFFKKLWKKIHQIAKTIPKKNTAADNLKVDSNSKKNAHYIFNFLKLGGS
jgi:hypothetical protein